MYNHVLPTSTLGTDSPLHSPSTNPNPKHTSRTDHNILSLHLLLPEHPPLHSPNQPKKQFPPVQTFHAWKLKHTEIKEIFQKDLEVTASDILPQLQALLDNNTHQIPQQRADAACNLIQTALLDTASAVLSSPAHTNKQAGAHTSNTPDTPKPAHPNPTTTVIGLRLEIQKLKDTIATREKENPHNPELPLVNKLCNQKKRGLTVDYKRQNSALLHMQAHEIKVTHFNATMKTAWQLLHDYKSNEVEGKPQLPSQMRTNKSIDKRLWWPDHIQRAPALGIQGYHQYRYALGHDLLGHPALPWDEGEATRVQADLDAPHPSDSHIPDPQLNMRPTQEEIKTQIKPFPLTKPMALMASQIVSYRQVGNGQLT